MVGCSSTRRAISRSVRAASRPEPSERPGYVASLKLVAGNRMFWVMCALSFVLTLLRKTFEFWMPQYFSDMGASASAAAFKSAVFPLIGCVGTFATGWISDRFLGGRRAPVMTVLLVLLAGVLVALPTMAGGRAIWEFFRERVELERWDEGGSEVPVEVELEPPKAASGSPPVARAGLPT